MTHVCRRVSTFVLEIKYAVHEHTSMTPLPPTRLLYIWLKKTPFLWLHAMSTLPASYAGNNTIGVVQADVEKRLRNVSMMQRLLPSNAFCSLELSPLLQSRKRPLEEMMLQCNALTEARKTEGLW